MKVVLVTRTHRVAATVAAGLDKINTFVENGLSYADAIYICVDIREDLQDISYYEEIKTKFISNTKRVKIIPISNWGKFTFPLNIALLKAINEKYEYIIYQSLEYMTTSICVTALLNQLKLPDTLVVGPAMEGHEFSIGRQVLTGRTCPWNTMAIWDCRILGLIGFPMVGDGMGESWGGVEEVSAVALHQMIRPSLRAVLVHFNNTSGSGSSSSNNNTWNTDFKGDEKRAAYHAQKMASKVERPALQMRALGEGVPQVWVEHIEISI